MLAHALIAARPRQLRARALRPLRRRRFPRTAPPRLAAPVAAAAEIWRSDAFAPAALPDESTRLGRFHRQYAEDVLMAARSGDAVEARRLLETWIEAHTPRNGDAWHPYPLSTRVGNWVAAITLVPELATEAVSQSLWHQLLRLRHNVEDDVLGNHVIRNARALVLGGAAFAEQAMTRQGIDILSRELPEQVLRDGGHYERSPAYHLVVLRDLLEVQAVSPHSWLADVIASMRAFAAAMLRPDGAPALFNDGTIDAPRLELPPPPDGLVALSESGFVVVRDGDLWLACRCGQPSPPFLPAHAHADALSLQVWWRRRPVIVDPGTFTYEPGRDRDHFRGTRAHSTVTVDGRDQFPLWGAFRAGPLAPVRLRYVREGALEASVDLRGPIRHVRRLEWDAASGEIVVEDLLQGTGRHHVESRLVWAPDAPPVDVAVIGDAEVATEEAWLSERFGERVPTTATVAQAELTLPSRLGFRIRCVE